LKQVSISEITAGTDLSELFKIVEKYSGSFRINLGIETGDEKFVGTVEEKVFQELCRYRTKIGYCVDVHLNGDCCRSMFDTVNCYERRARLPDRAVLNLNTIEPGDFRAAVKNTRYFDGQVYLLNGLMTNAALDKLMDDKELAIMEKGMKFLNWPGNFDSGFNVIMPLFGNSADWDWCGALDPDEASEALDWITARYGYACARVMTRGGVMTDKKTDLTKVGEFLKAAAAWNERAKTKEIDAPRFLRWLVNPQNLR